MSVAGVAHPVERHLAKVEVASSSLVTRSMKETSFVCQDKRGFFLLLLQKQGKIRVNQRRSSFGADLPLFFAFLGQKSAVLIAFLCYSKEVGKTRSGEI